MTAKNEQRTRDLAAIHAAKRDLALDDDLYRDLLEQWTTKAGKPGKRSAADLNARERGSVLNELRKLGASRTPRERVAQHPGTPHNLDAQPMLQKIEAQLADMQLPWSYADAIAKQQTGIARVAWVRKREHLDAVIAALYVEQEKRGLWAQFQELMTERGLTETYIEERFQPRKGWRRHRKALNTIIMTLTMEEQ